MAKTPKYPNPAFFRTKNNMDWKAQGENLKEVFDIAKDMLLATDWKAFSAHQKQGWIDFGKRVAEEAAEIAAMSCAERRELLLKGEKKLGRLYKKGAMATVRREWRGVADTAYDFYEWLRIWGMLLGTFSKDLIPALNSVLHYRWMMSYLCCVGFMDKNTMGQHGAALKMSHLMIYDIFRYVAENLVLQAKGDAKNGNIESVALKVIKGTPTTGTPADPACTRGDILEGAALVNEQPLWRIPLNGITVGTPIQMFDVLTPAKEAWDSVAQAVVKAAKVVLDNFRTSSTVVVTVPVAWPVDVSRVVAVVPSYVCQEYSDRIVVSDWGADGVDVRAGVDQNVSMTLHVLYV